MNNKKNYIILLVIPLIIIVISLLGLYNCPIRYIFGITCPMCGITRAITCLLNFDIKGSFYYHAGWPIIVILVFLYILYVFGKFKFNKKTIFIINILAVINLIYYFYRLFNGSNIIYFDFKTSLIYKIILLFS